MINATAAPRHRPGRTTKDGDKWKTGEGKRKEKEREEEGSCKWQDLVSYLEHYFRGPFSDTML